LLIRNSHQPYKVAAVMDSFDDVERCRLQLEISVAKLRKSLRYWQTWEAEYEGLKEEILRLGEEHTEAELVDLVFSRFTLMETLMKC